jgi:ferrous iron transport protein B
MPRTSTTASAATPGPPPSALRYALAGNPNTGKTTLFNRLCGARSKTANFPGSTVDARVGSAGRYQILDLPGHYGLNLDRPESRFCRDYLAGRVRGAEPPQAVLVVVDASNLARNLIFVSQAIQQGLPAVVALNMIDIAQRRGLTFDVQELARRLGVPVVPVNARRGDGVDALLEAMAAPRRAPEVGLPDPTDAHAAAAWADGVVRESVGGALAVGGAGDTLTDRLDAAFTHPVLGVLVFAAVMTGLFFTIFTLAAVPMDLIELLFAHVGELVGAALPPGAIHDLIADGVVPGIAGAVVFLPQICLLFFLISLIEDTGYLARAAFILDRLLRRFGLPGQAFVPLLSAHACAIPAIMSARLIPDARDRLATVLVAPFMSCSARLPVYVLLIGILFGDRPVLAGLAFTGCYTLGAAAALLTALLFRRTILPGNARAMVLELPTYKLPSLRTALLTTWDRAIVFLRKAGTIIVSICVVLWWLGAYPRVDAPPHVTAMREQAALLATADPPRAASLAQEADALAARHATEHTFIGRLGHGLEPVFRPIGYDWQLTIGVLSSFVAREVFVSTMAVVLAGAGGDPEGDETLRSRMVAAARTDGTPVFTRRVAWSLLVFYVLAMQCLPTLAVTARETGRWKWAILQLGYMSVVAYACALVVYQALRGLGVA